LELAREPMFESEFGKVCFGWMLYPDGTTWWHNGMTGGYSSYMAVNSSLKFAVVVLTNGASGYTTPAGTKIFQELAGMDVEPVKIKVAEKIDEDYAARLVGNYKSSILEMTITTKNGKLFAMVKGQSAFLVVPVEGEVGGDRFRYEAVDAELGFDVPVEGEATSVTLYQNGAEYECIRIDE
ncbi:MAG: serine hydrolase, partial [Phycisphaerales bacterium]|nr:serine hydrolase [Phycisphaerales bacterium]